jgi:hypothetical protein
VGALGCDVLSSRPDASAQAVKYDCIRCFNLNSENRNYFL